MDHTLVINTYDADYAPNFAIIIPILGKSVPYDVVIEVYHALVESSEDKIEIILSGVNGTNPEQVSDLSRKIPLKAIISKGKKGYADVIKAGLNLVSAPYVVMAGSDLQIRKKDFDILKEKFCSLANPQEVMVNLILKKRTRKPSNRLFSKVFRSLNSMVFDLPLLNDNCFTFRLMSTELAKNLVSECSFMTISFWTEFMVRAYYKNTKIVEVGVKERYEKSQHQALMHEIANEVPITMRVVIGQLISMVKLKRQLSGETFFTSILRTRSIRRLITFALVGTTGALLTLLLTWVGVNFHLYYLFSAAIGIQLSIMWAFLLHDRITFKDKIRSYRLSNILFRYFKYNISSLGGQAINLFTLFILTTLGIFYLHSEMVAIMVAFMFNYTISRKWVWGKG